MKHVQACLSARDYRESRVHHSLGPVRLVQGCYVRKLPDKAVLGGAVKQVRAYLITPFKNPHTKIWNIIFCLDRSG